MTGALTKGLDLLGRQITRDLGGAADNQDAIGKFFALSDQSARPDQATTANSGSIEHHCADTDQRIIADRTTVQYDLMSNGDPFANRQRLSGIGMQHASILDI
jgi:hypothetical protein